MQTKSFLYVVITLFALAACKKEKLKGEYSVLEGKWHWSRGWGDGGTFELKLDLKERGRYNLFRNKNKIEYGRLEKKNGYITFISEKLFNNKDLLLNTKQIVFMSNDSINVTKYDCKDCALSTFVKD